MKNILDRIEREEKQEQRNKKKQESAEEKQKRVTAINQQKALYKHKEVLKKEILRKRSLMEKNLQQEIYVSFVLYSFKNILWIIFLKISIFIKKIVFKNVNIKLIHSLM